MRFLCSENECLSLVSVGYILSAVIKSFRDEKAEALLNDEAVPALRAIERVARRKLLLLHRAQSIQDLSAAPGNRLEALKGGQAGRHAMRITKRWRICFRWRRGDAYDVEIVYE